jgi:hypothetical protein
MADYFIAAYGTHAALTAADVGTLADQTHQFTCFGVDGRFDPTGGIIINGVEGRSSERGLTHGDHRRAWRNSNLAVAGLGAGVNVFIQPVGI